MVCTHRQKWSSLAHSKRIWVAKTISLDPKANLAGLLKDGLETAKKFTLLCDWIERKWESQKDLPEPKKPVTLKQEAKHGKTRRAIWNCKVNTVLGLHNLCLEHSSWLEQSSSQAKEHTEWSISPDWYRYLPPRPPLQLRDFDEWSH